MPAIQPARLKHQIAQLSFTFEQPVRFVKTFINLLNQYADHTHRSGLGGEPPPLLESFRVPQPVLSEVTFGLRRLSHTKPAAALELSLHLWQEPVVECRLVATAILGQIRPDPPELVFNVIREWLDSNPEERIMKAIIEQGMKRLRQEKASYCLEAIKEWLSAPTTQYKRYGLWSIYFLAIEPGYQNLPEVFYLLTPYIRTIPKELRSDILGIFAGLIQNAPEETAYFLRQNLNRSDALDTSWITRQLIQEFPQPIQDKMRTALRSDSSPNVPGLKD